MAVDFIEVEQVMIAYETFLGLGTKEQEIVRAAAKDSDPARASSVLKNYFPHCSAEEIMALVKHLNS